MIALPDPGPVCPYLAVDDDALSDNIGAMARWCADRGVAIAPHAKTTMSPYVVRKQLAAGAWGLTVANVTQAAALGSSVDARLMIANQVVGGPETDWLVRAPGDPLSWVDSVAQVDALDRAASARAHPLSVLVEVGLPDGRAGARSLEEVLAVSQRVRASRHLLLRGVAGYEGSYGIGSDPGVGVDAFLARVEAAVGGLDEARCFDGLEDVIVTVGGSIHFDRCVRLTGVELRDHRAATVLLRSGCYAVHDDGLYARSTPSARGVPDAPLFRSAVSVVARVQSRPEPDLVIVGAGRRDLAYDQDLPVVLSWHGADGPVSAERSRLDRLDDQHAYVRVAHDSRIAVGDRAVLGISHPCSVFDRWRTFQIVRGRRVVGTGETVFS
ncbi:amino acid deaminase [Nocardioides endophyticus]|uniref:Amino acid deaminase n=1 Tax=Nocardioides endophyticus TaxID=1353775 RepID=A0ABP8Z9K3_9ACTN